MYIGTKDEMAALEEGFIDGTYTPFEKVQEKDVQKMEEQSVQRKRDDNRGKKSKDVNDEKVQEEDLEKMEEQSVQRKRDDNRGEKNKDANDEKVQEEDVEKMEEQSPPKRVKKFKANEGKGSKKGSDAIKKKPRKPAAVGKILQIALHEKGKTNLLKMNVSL